ncbi:IS256 family transposase [Zhenpiania hominis]|uniref:IS256 family transposase n=1 Tax=Zhenpiania hominis TaxID=2763644 RepID=UPI0039F60866
MAQINITLNQDEILQLMSNDREGAFKRLLQESLNSFMKAESTEQLKAEPYERTEERADSRNGFRDRKLNTRIGTITLKVPRHRNGSFETLIFDEYTRSEAALIASMMEMVVNGVSTAKVGKVVETLCGTSFSKSTVSNICKELDKNVNEFLTSPITGEYPFVTVDATYFKVREERKILSKARMVAYAVNRVGIREVIGFGVYSRESKENWKDFFLTLKNRGLTGVRMITSDAHEGIQYAISQVFPDVPWQRCQVHFTRNILDKTPNRYREGLRTELREMFTSNTIEQARNRRDEILQDYRDIAEKAMECLETGFESAMTVMIFSENTRKVLRTSNHIERLNRELKRRANVIGIFPNSESLLRLMGSVILERNDVLKSAARKVFYQPAYEEIIGKVDKLQMIAMEQRQLLAA